MTGPRTSLRQTGCTILLTAAVALPAGFWLAGTMRREPADGPAAARSTPTRTPAVRDVYSADIRSDPYVLAQQRALVEAMERACRQFGSQCPEARQARKYLDARDAAD